MEAKPILQALKAARRALGISQTQLAKKAGIHLITLGKIERLQVDPKFSNVLRILNVLTQESQKRKTPIALQQLQTLQETFRKLA